MSEIAPLNLDELAHAEAEISFAEARLGYVPNSILTMARKPDLLRAYMQLLKAVVAPGKLRADLKQLIALVSSSAAGCLYCEAHTASTALRIGIPAGKVESIWQFEQDSHFDESERAALRFARDASMVPNVTGSGHFADLRKYFSDEEIVEMVAMISMFGFLNRWNTTLATELEAEPLEVGSKHLSPSGWRPGRHRQ